MRFEDRLHPRGSRRRRRSRDVYKRQLEVRLGSENGATQLSGISVVAAQYGPAGSSGIVAVIGPTRMDYSKVINAVRAARSALRDL